MGLSRNTAIQTLQTVEMSSTAALKNLFKTLEDTNLQLTEAPTMAPTFAPTIAPSMSEFQDKMSPWLLGGLGAGLLFLTIVACLLSRCRVAAVQQPEEQDAFVPRYGRFNYYFARFLGRRGRRVEDEEIPLVRRNFPVEQRLLFESNHLHTVLTLGLR